MKNFKLAAIGLSTVLAFSASADSSEQYTDIAFGMTFIGENGELFAHKDFRQVDLEDLTRSEYSQVADLVTQAELANVLTGAEYDDSELKSSISNNHDIARYAQGIGHDASTKAVTGFTNGVLADDGKLTVGYTQGTELTQSTQEKELVMDLSGLNTTVSTSNAMAIEQLKKTDGSVSDAAKAEILATAKAEDARLVSGELDGDDLALHVKTSSSSAEVVTVNLDNLETAQGDKNAADIQKGIADSKSYTNSALSTAKEEIVNESYLQANRIVGTAKAEINTTIDAAKADGKTYTDNKTAEIQETVLAETNRVVDSAVETVLEKDSSVTSGKVIDAGIELTVSNGLKEETKVVIDTANLVTAQGTQNAADVAELKKSAGTVSDEVKNQILTSAETSAAEYTDNAINLSSESDRLYTDNKVGEAKTELTTVIETAKADGKAYTDGVTEAAKVEITTDIATAKTEAVQAADKGDDSLSKVTVKDGTMQFIVDNANGNAKMITVDMGKISTVQGVTNAAVIETNKVLAERQANDAADRAINTSMDMVRDAKVEVIDTAKAADNSLTSGSVVDGDISLTVANANGESKVVTIDANDIVTQQGTDNAKAIVEAEAKGKAYTDSKAVEVTEVAAADATEKANQAEANAKANTAVVVSEHRRDVAVANALQDGRITQNEYDIYTERGRNDKQDTQIASLNRDMKTVKSDIADLQGDVRRLDGAIAGLAAASSMVMPADWNGEWAVQAGVGHYNGANALALSTVVGGDHWAARATASGSDSDDWGSVAVGASVTLSTGIFK